MSLRVADMGIGLKEEKDADIDKEVCGRIDNFIKSYGPVVRCQIVTDTRTLILEVQKDSNGNSKIIRRIK